MALATFFLCAMCMVLYSIQNRSGEAFEKARGGTLSPFQTPYDVPPESDSRPKSVALKALHEHPLDELEEALPHHLERKYQAFLTDLMQMLEAPSDNLNAIASRQKEVAHFAYKHQLAPSIVTQWPSELIFYLLIFERRDAQNILALESYEELQWTPETLLEAQGIARSLEFRREIYAYKGILEQILARGGISESDSFALDEQPQVEEKIDWVSELRKPSSQEGHQLRQRLEGWDQEEKSIFHKQIENSTYSPSEIDEMITGREFQPEEYDY